MSRRKTECLDTGLSDSDSDQAHDSEAAEYSKTGLKRRKLSPNQPPLKAPVVASNDVEEGGGPKETPLLAPITEQLSKQSADEVAKSSSKRSKPGVIYLSSLPPYLKPSAIRNLLTQRGFSPIARLFLAPASKAQKNQHSSKKNSRQLYAEGWIEFRSKRTAKRCAETLNATTVGGRKGGFYHDDIWNMKYLRGVGWDDLMAQVREERREEEVKRMEERRQVARETKDFIEGVEKGKMARGIQRSREKREKKKKSEGGQAAEEEMGKFDLHHVDEPGQGTWRQYQVKDGGGARGQNDASAVSDDVKRVLSRIF